LEETLRRVAHERSEAKRQLYRQFLSDAIRAPAGYHEQLDFLRLLEQLQPDHFRVLAAVAQPPRGENSVSIKHTLRRRLIDLSPDLIERLVIQLDDLRLTVLHRTYNTIMTPEGAQNLRTTITPLGQRFIRYLEGSQDSTPPGLGG